MICMKVGGDYNNEFAYELDDDHISHCVDSTFQSFMYAAVLFSPRFFLMVRRRI